PGTHIDPAGWHPRWRRTWGIRPERLRALRPLWQGTVAHARGASVGPGRIPPPLTYAADARLASDPAGHRRPGRQLPVRVPRKPRAVSPAAGHPQSESRERRAGRHLALSPPGPLG